MRSVKIFSIIVAVALFVCLPLTAYAKPPLKVTLLGTYYGSGENQAWHSASIMPVNNNTFGIYSEQTLELTTQIWMYFGLGTDDLSSFKLHIRKLSTGFQDNTSQSIGSLAMYLWNYNGSSTSGQLSIRTQVQVERTLNDDGTTDYVFLWHKQGDVGTRSVFSFILPFQNFMLGQTPIYFEMVELSVNGMTPEEFEVNQYAEQFQARLDTLEDIEERAYQQGKDIPVNDIQNYLSRTDGDHYFAAFHYMFAQSTLLSTMVTVVCLFGIIGFIIYGKKV